MGAGGCTELERDLVRGRLDAVYYIGGDEDVLKDEVIRAILDAALPPGDRHFNLDERRAAELDAETFHALVHTPSFLGGRRVVVIRGIEAWKRRPALLGLLERYVSQPASDTVLILVHSAEEKRDQPLVAGARVLELDALAPGQERAWLQGRAASLGVTLEAGALEHLVAATGGHLSTLVSELAKLAAALGPATATADDVARLVGVRQGETLSDMIEAVMVRETSRALSLVDVVLEQPGVTGVTVVRALGTALLGTRLARASHDQGARATQIGTAVLGALKTARPPGLGSWKDTAERWARWSLRWTETALVAALERALEADRALKSSGVSDESAILRGLLLHLAPRGEAAA